MKTFRFIDDQYPDNGYNHTRYIVRAVLLNDKNEVVLLKGIIQPIHYKDKFIGRNVYLMNDKTSTFTSLRSKIIELESELETSNKQTYALTKGRPLKMSSL